MRPVNHTPFRVPFVHTIECHRVAGLQGRDSRSEVYVVRDEQRLAGGQPEDEALMTPAVIVVGKHVRNDPLAGYLNATLMISEGIGYLLTAGSSPSWGGEIAADLTPPDGKGAKDNHDGKQLFHYLVQTTFLIGGKLPHNLAVTPEP